MSSERENPYAILECDPTLDDLWNAICDLHKAGQEIVSVVNLANRKLAVIAREGDEG